MNINYASVALGALLGILGTAIVDLRAFSAARKADRTATFDWALALTNWAIGAMTGIMTAIGASNAQPQ